MALVRKNPSIGREWKKRNQSVPCFQLFHSSDGSLRKPSTSSYFFVLFSRRLKRSWSSIKEIHLSPSPPKKNQNRNDIKREEKIRSAHKTGAQSASSNSFLLEPVPGDGLCMTVCCVFERRITKAKHMFLMYTGGAMMNVNRQHTQELKIIYAGCPFLPFHASSSSSSSHRKRFFALMKNLFLSCHHLQNKIHHVSMLPWA